MSKTAQAKYKGFPTYPIHTMKLSKAQSVKQ